MQDELMKFDPATGEPRPYPSHAAQWRNWHGRLIAWLFNPWTGHTQLPRLMGRQSVGMGDRVQDGAAGGRMKTCRICTQTKPADAYRGARSACRECEKAQRREWYAAQAVKPYQRAEMKAYYRQWYAAHAESVKARAVEWTKANPGKRRDVCRENMARQRDKLNDSYVRRMLAQEMGLRSKDIPQPLVEAQRELLKIKRYIREHSI